MPSNRALRLDKFSIDSDKYRELMYFCKRYQKRKKEADSLLGIQSHIKDGMPRANQISDAVASVSIKRERLLEENRIIDDTAKELGWIGAYILKNVIDGITYEYLDVPSGRRQFYEARREFFKKLAEKR